MLQDFNKVLRFMIKFMANCQKTTELISRSLAAHMKNH
ncbi:hypothetical protein AO385_1583 [Moraxella catarrhalis]|uniref:Uncharacterized protein n=1 Tax=Moraxella catarrhalis TaxID=480 RepID=A0A198UG40_MORCA|nr:hypothetical protein AO384_2213 [Moraxella catarrhalis]OAU98657.1 hypothetical protein AO385_1583 [Moraxella catarrhalis]OAU99664.1 hypothetical protein AO383_0121 [Moraxella catarrhalis]